MSSNYLEIGIKLVVVEDLWMHNAVWGGLMNWLDILKICVSTWPKYLLIVTRMRTILWCYAVAFWMCDDIKENHYLFFNTSHPWWLHSTWSLQHSCKYVEAVFCHGSLGWKSSRQVHNVLQHLVISHELRVVPNSLFPFLYLMVNHRNGNEKKKNSSSSTSLLLDERSSSIYNLLQKVTNTIIYKIKLEMCRTLYKHNLKMKVLMLIHNHINCI